MAVRLPCRSLGLALAAACLLSCSAAREECDGEACAAAESDAAGLLAVHTGKLRAEKNIVPHAPHMPNWNAGPYECDASLPLVQTPAMFKKCWDQRQWCCVDESAMLFASVMSPQFNSADPKKNRDATENATIYPESRSYAWAGSGQDLEAFLGLHSLYGDSEYATFGMQVQVGFNPLAPSFGDAGDNAGYGFQLLVFQVSDELKPKVFVPTFAQWFLEFTVKAGVTFSNEVADEILKAYNTLRPDQDVVDAWKKLTGCSRRCSAPDVAEDGIIVDNSTACRCHSDVVALQDGLKDLDFNDSFACMKAAFDKTNGKWSAGQARLALHLCTDVDPVNTGFGLGYDTIVSPLACRNGVAACTTTVAQRMTGREFVMPNRKIGDLAAKGFVFVGMLPLSADANGVVDFPSNATSKFCFQNPLSSEA